MPNEAPPRPPYAAAAVTGAVVFVIYLLTLAPTTAFWDTSEYIAAARVLGIPHPPGNPLFTLLAHTWGLIPLAATYAVRINLFAAVTSALAATFWFLVAERWLQGVIPGRRLRWGAAFAGVLVGAMSWTVWNQSTVNEKVYTVSVFSIALLSWLAVRWADLTDERRRERLIVLMVYLLALTSTNHMMGVLAAPLIVVYVLLDDWRILTRPRVIAGSVVAAVIGVSLDYIYLPIRAAQLPPINEGEPIGFFSHALMDVLNRAQYGKPSVFDRQADLLAQIVNYFQYWNWQFARDWPVVLAVLATIVFTALGLIGLWKLLEKDRKAGLAGAALLFTLTFLLIFYLNFKYGYSYHPGATLSREVRERDYFFIASFSFFGVFIALGLGTAMAAIAGFLRDRGTEASRWAAASPLLALAVIPILGNRVTASRAHEWLAHDFAVDMLQSVDPYGILITAGDNDTFPLWFAQEVEGVRPDVTLANLSLMNTRWHLHQLRRRATPLFDPAHAIRLWRPSGAEPGAALSDTGIAAAEKRWPRPTTPVFTLSQSQLDSLPEVTQIPAHSALKVDSVTVKFGSNMLLLQDIATAFLIKDNLGKRPIFFSWSDGGYPDETLGLSEYLVTQGLVRKLMTAPVTPNDSIVVSPMLGFTNLPRTEQLLWNAYHWRSASRARPRGWVDAPSASILSLYAIVYSGGAQLLRERGDTAAATRADSIATAVRGNLPGYAP